MNQTVIVLNNIRSLYNVGSIFRTSDALGIDKLYLCGITGTPKHPRLAKTALAALQAVPWLYRQSAYRTIKQLKKDGYYVVALEITPTSKPIYSVIKRPLALVIGHERQGVDKRILELADEVLHIPMKGVGVSMNVAVAYGIAISVINQKATL
jgi:23S rRNA (guanosine2251-2'-O)-methyltransferase